MSETVNEPLVLPAGLPDGLDMILVKAPRRPPAPHRDEAIAATVSEILLRVERDGMDAVRAYSQKLDGWSPESFAVTADEIAAATAQLSDELKAAIEFAQRQVRGFAQRQRDTLVDFEAETLPGIFLGQRQVPVRRVGAYVPAGRVPMLAAPFMTILVAKAAGVDEVIACSPPDRAGDPSRRYCTRSPPRAPTRIFALGGVQALAAMAFGLEGLEPVDMIVGPGNAFVAEAKRQLFGRVGIDLLAGPSEVTVLADETADPELVAADLLGPSRARADIAVDPGQHQRAVRGRGRGADRAPAGQAAPSSAPTRCRGPPGRTTALPSSPSPPRTRSRAVDGLAPEHLEVQTDRDDVVLRGAPQLWLDIPWSAARRSRSPTRRSARTTRCRPARRPGTPAVCRCQVPQDATYQRVDTDAGVAAIAPVVAEISRADLMPAHEATANLRLERWAPDALNDPPEHRN